jgi:hypothetical protein
MNKKQKKALIEYFEDKIAEQKKSGKTDGGWSACIDGIDYWFRWNEMETKIYDMKVSFKNSLGVVHEMNDVIVEKTNFGKWLWLHPQ